MKYIRYGFFALVIGTLVAGMPARAADNSEFRLEAMMPYLAFEKLDKTIIDVGGAQIVVGFAPGDIKLEKNKLLAWVDKSARALSAFYGKFPVKTARVLLVPDDGNKTSGGQAFGNGGAAVRLLVGRDITEDALKQDWQLPHELVHLAFPTLQNALWLSEGLAVYVESIARAQAGDLTEEHIWAEFTKMMPTGLPKKGDKGLDEVKEQGRVYWGGATFWLLADLEIRKRTQGRFGLQDALLAIQAAGGDYEQVWSIERTLTVADQATGQTVLKEMYEKWHATPVRPDLAALWRQLGVKVTGKTVQFDRSAPLAATRAAITTRRTSVAQDGEASAKESVPDGRLLSTAACESKQISYADWIDLKKEEHAFETASAAKHGIVLRPFSELRPRLQTAEEFSERRAYEGFRCERIAYASDGLKVFAYIWRPADTEGKKLPLVIFNRGGGQDISKLVPSERDGFYDYLKSGFVVIGSQYRGNDGGQGHDEEGGAEVRDVVSLVELARSLGYVDMSNVFMMGDSRGAMMTYLAMRNGARINAAAVVGSETDLSANLKRRPELREGYSKNVPEFDNRPEEILRSRSAIFWPESISAPLLLMHGGNDWRVPVTQDFEFANKLESLRRPYELTVFEGDVHLLSFNWRERDRKTIEWFRRHMAK